MRITAALSIMMVDWVGERTFAFLLFFHLQSAHQTDHLGHGRGKIINITLVKSYSTFFSSKLEYLSSLFQLKNPDFQKGESSGSPEFKVHVSGDDVEVAGGDRGSQDGHKAQGKKRSVCEAGSRKSEEST